MYTFAARRAALIAAVLACLLLQASEAAKVRPAAVAGSFYPAQREELQKTVDGLLADARVTPVQGRIRALISPHAGYPYSGTVAASAYALLKGSKCQRVVVIAPSHYDRFSFASVYDGDAYVTPLGTVPIDKEFAEKLAASSPLLQLSSRGHTPSADQREHAIEVELPFLQRTLGDFRLVPIIMGEQDYESSRALAVALAKLIGTSDTLIVASSDLSHYHPYDEATSLDHKLLRGVEDWDYYSLSRNIGVGAWEACGGAPIVAAMMAAERLGATRAALVKYANSGDITGDRTRVVGYGAVALVQPPGKQNAERPPYSLKSHEKSELLKIARRSVETAVRERKLLDAATPAYEALRDERGAFVTLTKRGELRGCIGYTSAVKPLFSTVRDVAALAALRDPRFPAVTPEELSDLTYEISVLSPFRRVTDIDQIQVGRHGLLVRNSSSEGILLPQVAVDQHWNRKTFVQQACAKAGLPTNCWQSEDTDLFVFTAVVFSDRNRATEDRVEQPPVPGRAVPPASGPGSQPQ